MTKKLIATLLALSALCCAAFADFTDVSSESWYAEAVAWAEDNGIMDGVAEGVFDPNGSVTRAMAVTILYRIAGEPDMPESSWGYPYADVPGESWFAAPVYWARLEGVADGVSDTNFDPNGYITREQLVTMLWRFDGEKDAASTTQFADAASISSWAATAVAWASNEGIISGREGGIFDPHGHASRAECAAILMRYDSYLPDDNEQPEYIPDLSVIAKNEYDPDNFYFDSNGYLNYGSSSLVGIDVSWHQGEIDWEAASEGLDFAIIRAGYRGYSEGELFEDEYFRDNVNGALQNGLKVGVYFFSQAVSVEEAVEEAQYLLSLIRGYNITGPVIFDWERISYDSGRTANVSGVTVTDCAIAFCEIIEAAGYQPMCYGSPSTSNRDIYLDRLTEYPFWLAHYTKDTAITQYPYHYDMWQYSSTGSVPGIEGNVDLNVAIDNVFGL